MSPNHFVLREQEYGAFLSALRKLRADAFAKVVFLVDKNGTLLASTGEAAGFDTTALASLAAGNIAATGGLANLIGEKEFSILFHEGERDHLHLSIVGKRAILVVHFDARTTLGIVRLRAKGASDELNRIFAGLERKAGAPGASGPFAEITDDDIDNLFRG